MLYIYNLQVHVRYCVRFTSEGGVAILVYVSIEKGKYCNVRVYIEYCRRVHSRTLMAYYKAQNGIPKFQVNHLHFNCFKFYYKNVA